MHTHYLLIYAYGHDDDRDHMHIRNMPLMHVI